VVASPGSFGRSSVRGQCTTRGHLAERGCLGAPPPSVLEARARRLIRATGLPLAALQPHGAVLGACAETPARLAGISGAEVVRSDVLADVDGPFDLVVSNPPFVVSPGRRYTYRDAGLDGDEVCSRLVAEIPAVLAPGGYHLMLRDLKPPLVAGQSFPLTLNFAKAGALTTTGRCGHSTTTAASMQAVKDVLRVSPKSRPCRHGSLGSEMRTWDPWRSSCGRSSTARKDGSTVSCSQRAITEQPRNNVASSNTTTIARSFARRLTARRVSPDNIWRATAATCDAYSTRWGSCHRVAPMLRKITVIRPRPIRQSGAR